MVSKTSGPPVGLEDASVEVAIETDPLRLEFRLADGTPLKRDERERGMGFEGPKCQTHQQLAAEGIFRLRRDIRSGQRTRGYKIQHGPPFVRGFDGEFYIRFYFCF